MTLADTQTSRFNLDNPSSQDTGAEADQSQQQNVGTSERGVSLAAGAILAALGVARRDTAGLLIAGIGGGLMYRGASGNCPLYRALGTSTVEPGAKQKTNVHVAQTLLIDRPADELYRYWRDFQNLPRLMTHIESVQVIDEQRSHWVAKIKGIPARQLEWDATITADEPNVRIAWRSEPNADIENWGEVQFERALGDRGTAVRASINYIPPGGAIGRWLASYFTPALDQQIRDDLRNFKRMMEVGEIPTIEGQPRGTCTGHGMRSPG